MTETHIGVWKAPHAANVWYWQHPGCAWNAESTLAAAADAGRAHLAEHHAQPMTPFVQAIVSGTRCTCGDLPRNTYPYFSPCPVHSYLINAITTTNAPAQGYCRLHGVRRSVCGCRVASVDPDALGGRESGSCDFISYTLHDNPLQTAHNTSREDC